MLSGRNIKTIYDTNFNYNMNLSANLKYCLSKIQKVSCDRFWLVRLNLIGHSFHIQNTLSNILSRFKLRRGLLEDVEHC